METQQPASTGSSAHEKTVVMIHLPGDPLDHEEAITPGRLMSLELPLRLLVAEELRRAYADYLDIQRQLGREALPYATYARQLHELVKYMPLPTEESSTSRPQ